MSTSPSASTGAPSKPPGFLSNFSSSRHCFPLPFTRYKVQPSELRLSLSLPLSPPSLPITFGSQYTDAPSISFTCTPVLRAVWHTLDDSSTGTKPTLSRRRVSDGGPLSPCGHTSSTVHIRMPWLSQISLALSLSRSMGIGRRRRVRPSFRLSSARLTSMVYVEMSTLGCGCFANCRW